MPSEDLPNRGRMTSERGFPNTGIQAKGVQIRLMRLLSLAVLIGVLEVACLGQTFRGTILGNVTDATGAAVVGAKVTIHNMETGQTRS